MKGAWDVGRMAVGAYNTYQSFKNNTGTMTTTMRKRKHESYQGLTPEWRWCSDKFRRYALNLNKLNVSLYTSYISRFQSLTPFNTTPCAHKLAMEINTGGGTPYVNSLPMYAFDLSSMAKGNYSIPSANTFVNSDYDLQPFYRLTSQKTLSDTLADYTWAVTSGKKNNPDGATDGTVPWIEEATGVYPDVYPNVNRFIHEWSDIRVVMAGAKDRPSRVHIKLVRFVKPEFAPRRILNQRGDFTNDPMELDPVMDDSETVQQHDNFWDSFWGHRITNPIRSVRNTMSLPIYEVLYHKTFNFGTKLSTELNTNADQQVFKLFYENNSCYSTETGRVDQEQTGVVGTSNTDEFGYKAWQTDRSVGIPPNVDTCPWVKGNQGTWLLVYADNFYEASGSPPTPEDNKCPSFDLLVRGKHTMAHSPN